MLCSRACCFQSFPPSLFQFIITATTRWINHTIAIGARSSVWLVNNLTLNYGSVQLIRRNGNACAEYQAKRMPSL